MDPSYMMADLGFCFWLWMSYFCHKEWHTYLLDFVVFLQGRAFFISNSYWGDHHYI